MSSEDSFCEIGFEVAWENMDSSIGILIAGRDNRSWIVGRWGEDFHIEYGEKKMEGRFLRYLGWIEMLEGRVYCYERF